MRNPPAFAPGNPTTTRAAPLAVALVAALTLAACGRSGLRNPPLDEEGPDGRAPDAPASEAQPPDGGGTAGVDGTAGSGGGGDAPRIDAADARPDGTPDAGGADGGVDGKRAVSLQVSPALLTVAVGGMEAYTATLQFSDGTTSDVTAAATWASGDQQIATVKAGHVVALRAGKVSISATLGGLTGAATLEVMSTISLVAVIVDPPQPTLSLGTSVTFTATGLYSDGSTSDVTAMTRWDTSAADVVSLDAGVATARKVGQVVITATVGTVSGKAVVMVSSATVVRVSVLPPMTTTGLGATARFTADATLSDGTHQDATASAAWSSADELVAVVDARGVATGKGAGQTRVTATLGGQSGSAALAVTAAALTALQLDPVDPTLGVGVSSSFTLTGLYADGSRADLTAAATWASSASTVLVLDGAGHAQSKSVGTSVVTASSGGLTAQSTVTVTAASLKTLALSPPAATLTVGDTAGLRALGTYSDGTVVDLTASVTWSAAPDGVVSVSNAAATAGTATALAAGTATVTARAGLITGTAKLSVSLATLEALVFAPAATAVPIGATVGFKARGTFSDGSTRDVTSEVDWSSSADKTATVSNTAGGQGVATGVTAGDVIITAASSGVTATASLSVVAATLQSLEVSPGGAATVAGLRSSYAALGVYSDGGKADLTRQVTWSTENAAVATISNVPGAEGQLLARAPGTTTVTAALGSIAGTTSVTVTGATASSLSVSPMAASTPIGTAVQYTATLILTNGTTRNVTGQTAWSSTNVAAATIDARGRAVPVAVGSSTVSGVYQGLSSSTTLTVTSAVVIALDVTPAVPSVPVGTVVQFTATAIFSDLTTRNVTANATWVSAAPAVMGVNTARNRGRATAVSKGSATISATYMGLTGSTTATVTDAVIVSLSLSPVGLTLPVGARRQFTAEAIRSDGTSQAVTGAATWTSDAPAVAAVSTTGGSRGLVTAIGAGGVNIKATYMGLTGSVGVTVTAATLLTIQVTPFNPTVAPNTSLQFAATGVYSDGSSAPLTGLATWLSMDGAVAAISNAAGSRGLASSLAKGSTRISATFMNVTGSTTLLVTDATITQLQVTPFNPSIPSGFQEQLTATAIYSDGTNRDVTALATWTSTQPGVANVSDALATKGFVSAGAAGAATIKAQYTGVAGSTEVSVSGATLTGIAISPADSSLAVGELEALTATGAFDDGSTLDITAFVTWTSSDPGVADVSNADGSRGQASAFSSGATIIKAQRGAVSGTTTLTVK